jgi:hypothetical protein
MDLPARHSAPSSPDDDRAEAGGPGQVEVVRRLIVGSSPTRPSGDPASIRVADAGGRDQVHICGVNAGAAAVMRGSARLGVQPDLVRPQEHARRKAKRLGGRQERPMGAAERCRDGVSGGPLSLGPPAPALRSHPPCDWLESGEGRRLDRAWARGPVSLDREPAKPPRSERPWVVVGIASSGSGVGEDSTA